MAHLIDVTEAHAGRFPDPQGRVFECSDCSALLREGFKLHTAKEGEKGSHQLLEVTR